MWFLHPLQQAPVIVFESSDRAGFIDHFAALDQQLRLRRYEGWFVEAVDARHVPFVFTWGVARGEVGGGQWSSDHCHYPFPTGGFGGRTKQGCTG